MQTQLLSSKSEHWCTPETILSLVRQLDEIGLDPCSNKYSTVNAKKAFTLPTQDGLATSWQNEGLVFVNPPYGRKLPKWVKKITAEALLGSEIVALLPARTDTRWFHQLILPTATHTLLWRGRITFVDGTTGLSNHAATFPSMLVYWGQKHKDSFKETFADRGLIITRC